MVSIGHVSRGGPRFNSWLGNLRKISETNSVPYMDFSLSFFGGGGCLQDPRVTQANTLRGPTSGKKKKKEVPCKPLEIQALIWFQRSSKITAALR